MASVRSVADAIVATCEELSGETVIPYAEDMEGFRIFMERYKKGIAIEKTAIETMVW